MNLSPAKSDNRACLGCGNVLPSPFLDLGLMPGANSFITPGERRSEPRHPLAVACCHDCCLVQLTDLVAPEDLFTEYLYLSSFSETFLKHAESMAVDMTARFGLDNDSFVVEIASNDGYLLQHFLAGGIPVLGVEPAKNIADIAIERGIPTLSEFFSSEIAEKIQEEHGPADVVIGNNVLAHVPTVNDFLSGTFSALKPSGVAIFEFPYLVNFLESTQFDTVYHEHVFYYSLSAITKLAERAGLEVFDAQRFPVHGGSLRVFIQKPGGRAISTALDRLLSAEQEANITSPVPYEDFARRVLKIKDELVSLLKNLKGKGYRIAAYGAPAKGNTLLNYCAIGQDIIDFTVDRSPHKQGLLTPGMNIPISPPERLMDEMPDYTLILPWNLADEIIEQQAAYREKGGKFIIPIPSTRVI